MTNIKEKRRKKEKFIIVILKTKCQIGKYVLNFKEEEEDVVNLQSESLFCSEVIGLHNLIVKCIQERFPSYCSHIYQGDEQGIQVAGEINLIQYIDLHLDEIDMDRVGFSENNIRQLVDDRIARRLVCKEIDIGTDNVNEESDSSCDSEWETKWGI